MCYLQAETVNKCTIIPNAIKTQSTKANTYTLISEKKTNLYKCLSRLLITYNITVAISTMSTFSIHSNTHINKFEIRFPRCCVSWVVCTGKYIFYFNKRIRCKELFNKQVRVSYSLCIASYETTNK